MNLGKKMRALAIVVGTICGVSGVIALSTPASAISVPLTFNQEFGGVSGNGVIFDPGDTGTFGEVADNGSFFVEFQVSTVGTISAAVGQESIFDPDLDITSVSLINQSAGPAPLVGNIDIVSEPDSFTATWFSLLPGNTYRLAVAFDGSDVFSGNLSFAAIPVPPAAILFGTALVGMGFLSRRRRRRLKGKLTIA